MHLIPGRLARRGARQGHSKGQSLVEFALVLPVVLLILLLTIDVGRLYYGWVNLQNAARIGANYAALHPSAWGPTPDLTAQTAYAAQIRSDAAAINCVLPAALPTPSFVSGGATSLGEAQVTLGCRFDVITSKLLGIQSLQLGAGADFPIRNGTLPIPSPTATPVPTATPLPTPTPTAMCTVPTLLGTPVDGAASAWTTAGFAALNLTISLGTGNYTIRTEAPSGQDATSQNCATFAITVVP